MPEGKRNTVSGLHEIQRNLGIKPSENPSEITAPTGEVNLSAALQAEGQTPAIQEIMNKSRERQEAEKTARVQALYERDNAQKIADARRALAEAIGETSETRPGSSVLPETDPSKPFEVSSRVETLKDTDIEVLGPPEIPAEELNEKDILTMEDDAASYIQLNESDIETMEEADALREKIKKMHAPGGTIPEFYGVRDTTPGIDSITNAFDLRNAIRKQYPNIELQPDGTPVNSSKKDFDSLLKSDVFFKRQIQKYQEMQRNAGVVTPKPKSGIRRFFEKIGLAAGLIGATAGAGGHLENRASADTRAAQINALSDLDSQTSLPEGELNFESMPEENIDIRNSKIAETIFNLPNSSNLQRFEINQYASADTIIAKGKTYIRLHNKRNGEDQYGILQNSEIVPDPSEYIHKLNMQNIEAAQIDPEISPSNINETLIRPNQIPESARNRGTENTPRTRLQRTPGEISNIDQEVAEAQRIIDETNALASRADTQIHELAGAIQQNIDAERKRSEAQERIDRLNQIRELFKKKFPKDKTK